MHVPACSTPNRSVQCARRWGERIRRDACEREKKPRKHKWSDGGMTVGGKGIQRGRKHFPLCTPSIDRIAQRICECDTVGYRTGGIKSLMRNQGKT